ncbi:HAD hydrolase-like protein [Streptomyces sp. SID8352]|uniref:HAD-IIA family hydrolase n=1 Tax=Streptomyces sp. SID8352 TaxID=2690338 RepID=UPI00136F22ED|nr:HAD hydrolase-like protein [Streptomyces sp. SID8352]MYU22566.1 HAD hydrolase-like protein [Streptomyces sp. SID8352]
MTSLEQIRGWVLDVDGCLVRTSRAGGRGGTALPGAAGLLAALRAAGHRVIVCTNASEKAPAAYADHLRSIGLPVEDSAFVTAGSATVDHIHAHHPGARVLAVGDEGLTVPLREMGITRAGADDAEPADVVVVGAASSYSAADLSAAALAVDAGAAFYTTVGSAWFHGGLGRSLAVSGAVAASITWATGTAPAVGGKPSPVLAASLLRRLALPPEQVAVVGDAVAEIALARHMGARSVAVLSGALTPADLDRMTPDQRPDLVLDDVAELHRRLGPSQPASQQGVFS